MDDDAKAGRRRDVGCPFCGLICDDLTVEGAAGGLRITEGACRLSRKGFEEREAPAAPMVDGRPAGLTEAVARAGEILAASRAPVFAVAADVAGTRAVLRLADRLGGVVDHPDSEALFRNLRILQDSGGLTTTLSEVRNRADMVLIVGADPSSGLPRFFERCLEPSRTLFGSEPLQRHLFRLGPPANDASPAQASVPMAGVTELPCSTEHLPQVIAALNARLRGREIAEMRVAGIDRSDIDMLVDRLKAARYAVVIWAPALLSITGGDLIAHGLLELVRQVTRTTRCSVLALGGGGNLFGVNQVCTWQTGYPIRTAFGQGVPEHDPYRFSARRMVEEGEADALVWISAFAEASPPIRADVPTVVLAPRIAPAARAAAACIPVGIPGLDHAGQVFRTDGVVALRLAAQRTASAPDVSSVVAAIEAHFERKDAR
jgi:formylmethanofuran dehydrogenase subunit B